LNTGIGQWLDIEIRSRAEQHACHCDRPGRGSESDDGDAGIEPPHELLEHENGAGNRRIERGGEPGARTSRQQHLPVRPAEATDPSYQIGDRGSHLHARTLSAECQPGADRQQSAKKLHRDQLGRRRRQLAGQHGLDMWNAASRSRGRKATDEPRRNSDSASTCGDNE